MLVSDTCWCRVCISFRPGAGHPPLVKDQHTAPGEGFPSAYFIYRDNTAKAIEGSSFIRSGQPLLDLRILLVAGRR